MNRNKPLVSIIIVNYNGKDVLLTCLKSLEDLSYPNYELILVDNGSTDGSLKALAKLNTKFTLLQNDRNLGFAPANNQGVKVAKGEYLLLLNNDTIVSPDLLDKMVAKMESVKAIGAMQPKIYLMDKPGYLDNAGSFLNTIGFSNHWGFGQKDDPEFSKEREIFAAKGACLLTRASIVKKVGLFDDAFGSYFEESDYCWRVWMAGWKVLYYPETFIYHKVGFTSSKQSAVDINYHSLKNRLASFIKNFQTINLIKYLGIHSIFLMGLVVIYLLKLQFKKVAMILKAFAWNAVNFPVTLAKRHEIQRIRTKPDSKVLPIIMQATNFSDMLSHFKKVEKNFK